MKNNYVRHVVVHFLLAAAASSTVLSQSARPSPAGQQTLQDFKKEEIEEAKKNGVLDESELIPYLRAKRDGIPEVKPDQPRMVVDDDFKKALQTGKTSTSSCNNGGFEMGDFTNWSGSYGSNSGGTIYLNTLTPGFLTTNNPISSRHSILPMAAWPPPWQGPFDPMVGNPAGKTPIPLPVFPNGGNHMLRLGNQNSGSQAETASFYFQVTPANADFRFRYAVVLQDPGSSHAPSQKPFFTYWVYDLNHTGFGSPFIASQQVIANASDPFFETNTNGSLVWRRVSCRKVDLSRYIGHTVWVMFATADCSLGAHYGYAYIDGLCETDFTKPIFTMASEYCPEQPMTADGTQTQGETKYSWTMVETDSAGNNPVSGTLANETFPGQITAPIDLRAWYLSKGKSFQCGKYYKVTLRTDSECSTGDETSKVILNSCKPAPVITGPNSTCEGGGNYSVNAEPGTTYNWTIINGTPSSSTGPSVNVTWNTPQNGVIHVTARNACGTTGKTLTVTACKDKCCKETTLSAAGGVLTPLGGGAYTFNPTLKAAPPNTMKIHASIVSTSIAYSPPSCGSSGPASSHVVAGGAVSGFTSPTVTVPNGREVVWTSASPLGSNIAGGKVFPFKIQLPPRPASNCTDVVTFCIKYTFTDTKCNTCEVLICYCFRRVPATKGGQEPLPQLIQCPSPQIEIEVPKN